MILIITGVGFLDNDDSLTSPEITNSSQSVYPAPSGRLVSTDNGTWSLWAFTAPVKLNDRIHAVKRNTDDMPRTLM